MVNCQLYLHNYQLESCIQREKKHVKMAELCNFVFNYWNRKLYHLETGR